MLYGKWTVIKLKCLELQCTIAISKFPMHSKQKWQKNTKLILLVKISCYISANYPHRFLFMYIIR